MKNKKSEIKIILGQALKTGYDELFDIWADFKDAEAPKEVIRLYETKGLGNIDAVSFMAFCYGYEKAVQKIKERCSILTLL